MADLNKRFNDLVQRAPKMERFPAGQVSVLLDRMPVPTALAVTFIPTSIRGTISAEEAFRLCAGGQIAIHEERVTGFWNGQAIEIHPASIPCREAIAAANEWWKNHQPE